MLTPELLNRLKDAWARQRAPIVDRLRPGLSSEDIDEIAASLDLSLPEEARLWWAWHDGAGVRPGAPAELGPGLPFLTLREAAALCRHARQQAAEVARNRADYWWRPSWFPITERQGEIRCDCAVETGEPTPIFYAYSHDHDANGLTKPKVDSFGLMVGWWIEALETGAWSYNSAVNRWERHRELLPPEREASGLL